MRLRNPEKIELRLWGISRINLNAYYGINADKNIFLKHVKWLRFIWRCTYMYGIIFM